MHYKNNDFLENLIYFCFLATILYSFKNFRWKKLKTKLSKVPKTF